MTDKPEHILTIPDSLGRDIDRGKTPPIDAFMSDDSLQAAKDATETTAVHAESLRPITKADADRRTTFDGKTMPSLPHTRRVIPAPFRRDRVTGGHHGKVWQNIRASGILPGDIITGVGAVIGLETELRYKPVSEVTDEEAGAELCREHPDHMVAVGMDYLVTGAGGVVKRFGAGEPVSVFAVPRE